MDKQNRFYSNFVSICKPTIGTREVLQTKIIFTRGAAVRVNKSQDFQVSGPNTAISLLFEPTHGRVALRADNFYKPQSMPPSSVRAIRSVFESFQRSVFAPSRIRPGDSSRLD